MKQQADKNALFTREGRPPIKDSFPMALQHVVAMAVGGITMPMIIAGIVGIQGRDQVMMVQASLIAAGLAIILQAYGKKGLIGSGLPVMVGSGFAFLPTLSNIAASDGMGALVGAQMIGAFAGILVGLIFKRIRFLFPPIVTSCVVLTIGISLYKTAVKYMAGGSIATGFGSASNWILALLTLLVVVVCTQYGKGMIKASATLIGILAGCIVAMIMGNIDPSGLFAAEWFQVPVLFPFKPVFTVNAMISLSIVFIVNTVQDIGQFEATANGVYKRKASDSELTGGVIVNNICSLIGGILGGAPVATAGQNVGIVVTTGVINRLVFGMAGLLVLVVGLVPKLSAVFTMIPQPVLGGATITVFGSIAMTGIRMLSREGLTQRNTFIAGLSVALAIGIPQVSNVFAECPSWIGQIFGNSEIIIVALVSIILNLVLPKEELENHKS